MENSCDISEISSIVLSGGGHKGYIHLGVLNVLFQYVKLHRDIKILCGVSVGSLICFLLSLGYKPKHIMNVLVTDDKIKPKTAFNFDLFTKYGFTDMECLFEKVKDMINDEELINVTFEELLDKTAIHFVCCISNLDRCEPQYCSPKTTPGLRCMDAIMASCCLPFIFHAQKVGGEICVDGGITDNFPYDYIENYMKENNIDGKIFGVLLSATVKDKVESLLQFINRIILCPIYSNNLRYKNCDNILFIEDQNKFDKKELFELGMKKCQDFFLQIQSL